MTTQQAESARTRLEKLINALIEASVTVLSGTECQAFDGSTGLDATAVPLFSRGPSRRAGLCASDPDGGWYVREGDHRDTEDHAGRKRTKIAWALEATIATMAPAPRSDSRHPNLALGLALTRPGHDPAAPEPGSWPRSPPAAIQPGSSAPTGPTPPPCPDGSTCPPAPWATTW